MPKGTVTFTCFLIGILLRNYSKGQGNHFIFSGTPLGTLSCPVILSESLLKWGEKVVASVRHYYLDR